MKNPIILLSFLFSFAFAQGNDMYMKAMGEALASMKDNKTAEQHQATINQFSRIADAEDDTWIPGYYVVLNQAIFAFSLSNETDKIDPVLDDAQQRLDALLEAYPEESELWALQGMVYQARIQVNPMVRGMTHSGKANKAFEKAQELNPENPRAWLLHAQNIMHTPKFVGGGMEKACPVFEKALTAFEAFSNETPFWPNWGKGTAERYAGECSSNE